MEANQIIHSPNLAYLRTLPDNCIDTIITDSPYGLGKEPDPVKVLTAWLSTGYYEVPGKGLMGEKWDAFVPQPLLWRECFRVLKPSGHLLSFFGPRTYDWGTLAIRLAGFEIRDCIQWIYGTGFPKTKTHLKPANEPICVARKPGPICPLNIEEARIPISKEDDKNFIARLGKRQNKKIAPQQMLSGLKPMMDAAYHNSNGRFPSNVIFSEDAAAVLDAQTGRRVDSKINGLTPASNYFYVPKPSKSERTLPDGTKNSHPTVKPVKLMEHLVKLYSPEGGIVLDPHGGSGTTAVACINTSRQYILIDEDEKSVEIAIKRCEGAMIEMKSKLFAA